MYDQVLTKAAGRAGYCGKCKRYVVTKRTPFSVLVLSHASLTPNFKYGKLLHVRN